MNPTFFFSGLGSLAAEKVEQHDEISRRFQEKMDLEKEVNRSGFPLQIAIETMIGRNRKPNDWSVIYSEHAWENDKGESGFIDLILEFDGATFVLVIECKRVIVTTAKLNVCTFDPLSISLVDGTIDGAVFHEVPHLRFRKQLQTAPIEKEISGHSFI